MLVNLPLFAGSALFLAVLGLDPHLLAKLVQSGRVTRQKIAHFLLVPLLKAKSELEDRKRLTGQCTEEERFDDKCVLKLGFSIVSYSQCAKPSCPVQMQLLSSLVLAELPGACPSLLGAEYLRSAAASP